MPFDCYLKINGIDGEATAKGYEKWIQVLAFNSGVRQHGGGSTSGTSTHSGGRADFDPFEVVKLIDCATPRLAQYCAAAQQVDAITLAVCKSAGGKQKYMEYKLSGAVVMHAGVEGRSTGAADKPEERVNFRYDKIEWTYKSFTGDQPGAEVKAGWDVSKDAKV